MKKEEVRGLLEKDFERKNREAFVRWKKGFNNTMWVDGFSWGILTGIIFMACVILFARFM